MLIKYLRKNGTPIGVLVATDTRKIGYSFCNPKDVFRKDIAKKIALGRVRTIEVGKEHEIKTRIVKNVDVYTKEGFVKKDLKYYAVPAKHQKMFFEALDALIVRSEKYFKER